MTSAAMLLAICLLTLVEPAKTAEATSLPHNGKIAFTSNRGGKYDIYTVEPDGSNLTQLTDLDTYAVNGPHWSPDGTELTFSENNWGDMSIPVMSADGSNLRYIPTDPSARGRLYFFPTWSADGTKLAFGSRDDPDAFFDIFTMDLDGSDRVNLTKTPKYDERYPDFSPDGSQICFWSTSLYDSKAWGIYLMNADGSDPTLLIGHDPTSFIAEAGECDWSPDGTKIAVGFNDRSGYTSDQEKGDTEVYVIDADGSGLTALTSNSADDVYPHWSPDGTKIAFASNRDSDFEVYTMDADGSDMAQVTTNSGVDDTYPDWQPLSKPTPPKVHPPDTGGPSLLWVASALLFSGSVMFYPGLKRRV